MIRFLIIYGFCVNYGAGALICSAEILADMYKC